MRRNPNYPTHFKDAPKVKLFNYAAPTFPPLPEEMRPQQLGENQKDKNMKVLAALTGFTRQELGNLYRYPVDMRRVVNMTKKGKM